MKSYKVWKKELTDRNKNKSYLRINSDNQIEVIETDEKCYTKKTYILPEDKEDQYRTEIAEAKRLQHMFPQYVEIKI